MISSSFRLVVTISGFLLLYRLSMTRKGDLNRQIAADNRLLKEIKARITRLYNWSKEQAERPEGKESILLQLWQARQEMDSPDSRYGKIKDLKEQIRY